MVQRVDDRFLRRIRAKTPLFQLLGSLNAGLAANPDALSSDLFAANPTIASQFIAGHKQGFCVIDVARVRGVNGSSRPKYTNCATNQGISAGWADSYVRTLDGQWIDITGLARGSYVLEVEVNAEHLFTETNYRNNSAAVTVSVN